MGTCRSRCPHLYDDLDDHDLLQQCRAGRQGAWATLVRRFQRLVYTVPLRAGLGEAAAADVFQTTYARLVEHLATIEDGSRVRAWLVTTARRETLRALALQSRTVSLNEDGDADAVSAVEAMPAADPLPEALLSDLQQHDRLRRAVDRLDPKSRQFVELVFLQDEPPSYDEISSRLGIAVGSIGPTRARCLAKLRALLDEKT